MCWLKTYIFFSLQAYGFQDTIGCYLDLDIMAIKWSKNGTDLGKAYDIPAALRNANFYAAVVLKVMYVLVEGVNFPTIIKAGPSLPYLVIVDKILYHTDMVNEEYNTIQLLINMHSYAYNFRILYFRMLRWGSTSEMKSNLVKWWVQIKLIIRKCSLFQSINMLSIFASMTLRMLRWGSTLETKLNLLKWLVQINKEM